jgi:Flp pilus assembly protein TadD
MLAGAVLLALPLYAVDAVADHTISADLLRLHLSPKAKELLQKAQRAADADEHLHAIAVLETAREKYPEADAWTQSMLGVEYLKTGQFDAAVAALEQAVELLPREALNHANLGYALAATGQYTRAEQELQRSVQLDSGNLKTRKLLDVVRQRNLALTSSLR